MYFTSTVLASAAFATTILAATSPIIAFTKTPSTAQVGVETTIEWGGGDNSAVTITLKKGMPSNLQFVCTLVGNQNGTSFDWTPKQGADGCNLTNDSDYALEILQGEDGTNFSGLFSISGVTSSASSSSSSSATSSGSSSKTTAIAILPGGSGSASSSITAILTSLNGTLAAITSNATTTTAFVGAGAGSGASGASGSAGTGIPISRNTTFSSATLSQAATTGVNAGSSSSSAAASTTAASSSTGAPKNNGAGAMQIALAGPFAALVCVFAGFAYLL
ncbi:hypothetical protein MMC09_002875 [Bachmanniomyces sp. S44760]|nr:hypothetical protein [Bachmanniomyces sp. S44760]